MKLKNLLPALQKKELTGDANKEISSIVMHSQNAGAESLFVAVCGLNADGHDFLEDAYRAGARAFVTQKSFKRPGATNIIVPDSAAALSALAAAFYCQPSEQLKLIGVTGTNGKTTTAFIVESILKEAGIPVGLLSTIQYRYNSLARPAERTTPTQIELQEILREMADAGTRCVVMEVSSHGLNQRRVESCHFDVAVFTNLSPEHMDYHGTMDEYSRSKERFFTEVLEKSSKQKKVAVINKDDPTGRRLLQRTPSQTISFGLESGDVHAGNIELSLDGIKADITTKNDCFPITSQLIGTFNLYNILAAIAATLFLGIPLEIIRAGIAKATGVPGRMERIENERGILVFVDYAHTGDALENALASLKKLGAEQIITVFGCGGDRDRQKRPVMGRVAAAYSSVVILTSDNPRSEEPQEIIKEIEKGILEKGFSKVEHNADRPGPGKAYFVFKDRRAAIQKGISIARRGSVVLVAGKGHETYQQKGSQKVHFDDREEARQALKMCA